VYAYWAPDTLAQRAGHIRELNALISEVHDLNLELFAGVLELQVAVELCEFARADAALERVQAIAERTRQPTHRSIAHYQAAALRYMRGELGAAERLAEEAFRIGRAAGEPGAALFCGVILTESRVFQGRGAEMAAANEQAVANLPGVTSAEPELARLYCYINRRNDAAEMLARAAAKRFERIPHDPSRVCSLAMYADAAAQTGPVDAAGMLFELLEPNADQFVWNHINGYGQVRMYLALLTATLGRHEQADAHFAFARDFHREHGLLLWEARSQLGWAEALVARSETDRALDHAAVRSSSPASTGTARSSHAPPRSSKSHPPSAESRSELRRRVTPSRVASAISSWVGSRSLDSALLPDDA
jgi:hypothetical protein